MKSIRFTKHALEQCKERGTTEQEIQETINHGEREATKFGRMICRYNFAYNSTWQGKFYTIKQVAPVIKDEGEVIVVITPCTRFTFDRRTI